MVSLDDIKMMDPALKKKILIGGGAAVGLIAVALILRMVLTGPPEAPPIDQAAIDRNNQIVKDMEEKAPEETVDLEQYYEQGEGAQTGKGANRND